MNAMLEDEAQNAAIAFVDSYFSWIREPEQDTEGNGKRKVPAKRSQIKAVEVIARQEGGAGVVSHAKRQAKKSSLDDGTRRFWELLEREARGLKGRDDEFVSVFFESLCCHYYYYIGNIELSKLGARQRSNSSSVTGRGKDEAG